MPSGCLRTLELKKTHPYSIRDPSVQRWETHGDPSVQSLSSNHFHFFAVFTGERGRGFTSIILRLDDMLIHNLTYLFNTDGQIVCLKLMSKAPNQCRKLLFLDDYPIHRALGANPEQWKTFAIRSYTPKHVYVMWTIQGHNHLLLQRKKSCNIIDTYRLFAGKMMGPPCDPSLHDVIGLHRLVIVHVHGCFCEHICSNHYTDRYTVFMSLQMSNQNVSMRAAAWVCNEDISWILAQIFIQYFCYFRYLRMANL